jgi:uncharacterized protein (TIGR02996 family)
MSDEHAFLNAILANPKDDAPRLVYADWLDERGDDLASQKADFLRLTCRLLNVPAGPRRSLLSAQTRGKAASFDPDWLAVVSRLELEACASMFEFQCPKRWEGLRATDNMRVRWCSTCHKPVHFCNTIDAARGHARQGRCVAVNLTVLRETGDLARHARFEPGEVQFLGGIASTVRVTPQPVSLPVIDEAEDRPVRRPRRDRRERRRRKQFDVNEWRN